MTSRAVAVARTPDGAPSADDFEVVELDLPAPSDGEVVVQVEALSLDPYLRSLLDVGHLGEPAVGIGQTLPGRGVGTVVESSSPAWRSARESSPTSGGASTSYSRRRRRSRSPCPRA